MSVIRPFIVLALVLLLTARTLPQHEVRFPKDGNGLLEYCGPLIASFDSPPSQTGSGESHGIQMMKQGWCAGHLQTMREMIVFWQIQVAKTIAILNGDLNPSAEKLKEMMVKSPEMTCIPNEVNQAQMARILVKWLRDHPERLHEAASFLTLDAFHDAFPCQADTKKP
jgi:hypothetical protein